MIKLLRTILCIGVFSLGLLSTANANLKARGGGMVYDDVLDITWLADANYAQTSGYDSDGRMNFSAANTWAADLSYGGYDDWRLPTTRPINGSNFDYKFSLDGTTDNGYSITSPKSELAYMYHVALGLKDVWDATGKYQDDYGIFGNGTCCGENDVGLVQNLQGSIYWSGTEDPLETQNAWAFSTAYGFQSHENDKVMNEFDVWAVRDGDVAAIPEPETYAMLVLGLAVLFGFGRLRKQS